MMHLSQLHYLHQVIMQFLSIMIIVHVLVLKQVVVKSMEFVHVMDLEQIHLDQWQVTYVEKAFVVVVVVQILVMMTMVMMAREQ